MKNLLVQIGNTWIQMDQVSAVLPKGPSEIQVVMVSGEKLFLRHKPADLSTAINEAMRQARPSLPTPKDQT